MIPIWGIDDNRLPVVAPGTVMMIEALAEMEEQGPGHAG